MTDYIDGKLTPIKDNVIITDMYFGEQKTASGLIITNDDGNVRGIYPRWGRVHAKGPENDDPYEVGDGLVYLE
jgi:co-chaperonin GroES (HSP10)